MSSFVSLTLSICVSVSVWSFRKKQNFGSVLSQKKKLLYYHQPFCTLHIILSIEPFNHNIIFFLSTPSCIPFSYQTYFWGYQSVIGPLRFNILLYDYPHSTTNIMRKRYYESNKSINEQTEILSKNLTYGGLIVFHVSLYAFVGRWKKKRKTTSIYLSNVIWIVRQVYQWSHSFHPNVQLPMCFSWMLIKSLNNIFHTIHHNNVFYYGLIWKFKNPSNSTLQHVGYDIVNSILTLLSIFALNAVSTEF